MPNVRIGHGAKLYSGTVLLGVACSISFVPPCEPVYGFCQYSCKCRGVRLRYRQGKRRRNRGGNLICYNCGRVVK